MPKLGTFNLHGSLLPQYRGAAQNREDEFIRCKLVFHIDEVIHLTTQRSIVSRDRAQLSADIDVREMERAFEELGLGAFSATS